MGTYNPTPVGTLSNQQAAIATINENLNDIADVLKDKLDRVDGLPNEMQRDLDMNSNHVINVADPVADGDAVNLRTLRAVVGTGGGGGGEGGVSDHGLLTGLTDDDHPQYFNQVRGDARYVRIQNINAVVDGRISLAPVNALADVQVSNPVIGEVLKWNGTQFVNAPDATSGGAGATNLSATATTTSVIVASDTGTDATIGGATPSAAGVMTAADKAKLDGIQANATANSSDNTLLNRSNHIGTQTASTISDFTESVQDVMGATLIGASGVNVTYNDANGTITISGSGGGGSPITQLDDIPDVTLGTFPASPVRQFLGRDWTDPNFAWRNYTLWTYDLNDVDLYSVDLNDDLEPYDGKSIVYNTATKKWEAHFPNGKWEDNAANTLTINYNHRNKIIRATSASGLTVTVPTDTAEPRWPVGDRVWFYLDNTTSSPITFVGQTGVVLESPNNTLSFSTRFLMVEVVKRAPDTWSICKVSASDSTGGGSTTADVTHNNGTNAVVRSAESKLRDTASLLDFGANGDNVTDNAGAFTAAQGSPYSRIYVPEGTFYTTGPGSGLVNKAYYGPGKVRHQDGTVAPGKYTWLTSRPAAGTGVDIAYFFSGDNSLVESEYFLLGSNSVNLRRSLTEPYYESVTTPHFAVFQNFSGWSGTDCLLTVQANAGATTVTVNSTAGLSNGDVIGFNDANDNITDTRTITGLTATTISFTGGLSQTYPVDSRITRGKRTMNPYYNTRVVHRGGGDCYAYKASVEVAYTPQEGQRHIFFTSTGGIVGGDVNASQNGVFLTAEEYQCNDLGFDVGAVGAIWNLNRNNATGARGAFWAGTLVKSEGSAAVNSGHVLIGKFNVGIDMAQANADFGPTKCAIGLKTNDRIYFNNSSTPMGDYSLIGNVIGNSHISWNGTAYSVVANGTTALTMNATSATFANNVVVPSTGKFVVNGATATAYVDHDSTNDRMRFFTQGVERMRVGSGGVLVTGNFFVNGTTRLAQTTTLVPSAGENSGVVLSGWAITTGAGSIQAGGAQALPATPAIYIPFRVDNTDYWVPAYTRT